MHKMSKYKGIATCLLFIVLAALTSCGNGKYHHLLLLAEEQVTKDADSCAHLLEAIPVEELNREDEALYGLVHSWLLYRQYAKEIPEEPLEKAFSYYHDSKDPLRKAQVYFLHGVISQDQKRGQPSQWMEDLYSASLAIEQTDDYLLASQIYQNYSSKLSELNQFEEARVWIDKFVEAARRSGHLGEYVQSLIVQSANRLYLEEKRVQKEYNTNDGNIVASHTQFDEAFTIIYQALRIAQEHHMEVEQGRIFNQLSIYHSRCQHPDSVLHYARLSVQLNESLYAQGKRKQLTHYVTLAEAFRKLGMADSAIFYARKTYDTPDMPLRNKRVAVQLLYNIYSELKGDYQTSLEWMREYNRLNDSINQHTIASNIDAVQVAAVSEQEKSVLREEKQHTVHWLEWSVLIGVCAIVAISYHMLRNRRRYHEHLQEQESEFNRRILEMRARIEEPKPSEHVVMSAANQPTIEPESSAEEKAIPAEDNELSEPLREPEERIVLTGSTREQVEVAASSILFLTSESNYVKVLLLDENGKVQSKMIRQTMNNIEAQLNAYPYIIRCHRAFIVNLKHVRFASTASSGLQLTLDATSLPVPVSKTYLSLVRASLA